ncbi:hypothetical protein SPSPH_039890 [Sporomusa sphaeroides DSM 2875]|uniref:Uncharacterized protein n=1 Tax=Sporomusa sphaeroides DSM 2875 TaxID=1337886 RepID=A0ABM9W737_9FIRM|nr:hypothetical protein SPSPH_40430 [Sporomusa sphaeroides DSM 2875]CVK20902.1 hypothetical protein SSPH_03574 [Sporomusa sphaeroides DSM 2875]
MWSFAGMQMATVNMAFVTASVYRDRFAHVNQQNYINPGTAHLYY